MLCGHSLTFMVAQVLHFDVEVGVGTGTTFGVAAGVETGIAGSGSGVTDATNYGTC